MAITLWETFTFTFQNILEVYFNLCVHHVTLLEFGNILQVSCGMY